MSDGEYEQMLDDVCALLSPERAVMIRNAAKAGYLTGYTDASAGKPNRYETDKGGK